MHTRVAGFRIQVPFGDIPSDVPTAVIFPVGTNPVLHLKSISVLPTVLATVTMEQFPGAVGITKGKGNTTIKVRNNMLSWYSVAAFIIMGCMEGEAVVGLQR